MRHVVGAKRGEPAGELGMSDRDSVVGGEQRLLGDGDPLGDEFIGRQRRDGWLGGGRGTRRRRRFPRLR